MPFISDSSWTPSSYRAALAAWRASAPANDSEVMPARRKAKTRHAALSQKLRPLLVYRDPPSDAGIKTNWRIQPANDNLPSRDFFKERAHEMSPSSDEMVASVAKVDFIERQEARLAGGKFQHVPAGRIDHPSGDDVEWGVDRYGKPVAVRLARLHFSNGRHTERAVRLAVGGGVEDYAARLPTGALRYSIEKQTRVLGPEHGATIRQTNLRVADWFGHHELYEPVPSNRRKPGGKIISKAAERQMLADATANTLVMPVVKKMPAGLPLATKDLGGLFMSFGKSASNSGGQASWEDFGTLMDFQAAWRLVLNELDDETLSVLDRAMDAGSLSDIGRVCGASGSYAERAGKRALEAANDNLMAAMAEVAA